MIRTIADLQEYLLADKIALGRKDSKPPVFDFIWRFEISLRYLEYYHNLMHCNLFQHFFLKYWQVRYIINSIICGFEIPLNVFGKGLSIAHKGTIVVNGAARIGNNVLIGANSCAGKDVPDNVCIAGAPAKIIKNKGRLEIETDNRTVVR